MYSNRFYSACKWRMRIVAMYTYTRNVLVNYHCISARNEILLTFPHFMDQARKLQHFFSLNWKFSVIVR